MLGICGSGIAISSTPVSASWGYTGTFYAKGNSLLVDTEIAVGNEEYLHRAAVEVAFEIARGRVSDDMLLFSAVSTFFDCLRKSGTSNLKQNYAHARSCSALSGSESA
jgi:hypothetical protein